LVVKFSERLNARGLSIEGLDPLLLKAAALLDSNYRLLYSKGAVLYVDFGTTMENFLK
jgi:hypothetical protein